jgi:hypothetical protein
VTQAVSPAGGGEAFAAVKQLVRFRLEPAYPRYVRPGAQRFLRLVGGTGAAADHPRYSAGLAGDPRSEGTGAGQRESKTLSHPETGGGSNLKRAARSGGGTGHPGHPRCRTSAASAPATGLPSARRRRCLRRPMRRRTSGNGTAPYWQCWSAAGCVATKPSGCPLRYPAARWPMVCRRP